MKKALLLVAALAIGGAAFAQNKKFGLDIQLGVPISVNSMTVSSDDFDGAKIINEWTNAGFFQFKIATYNLPWVNNHIGLYGGIGAKFTLPIKSIAETEGLSTGRVSSLFAGEFMFGPAFGVDFGNMRFQSGVALCYMLSNFYAETGDTYSAELRVNGTLHSLGLALTPQFRTTVNRRCSFIVGADMFFGAPVSLKATTELKIPDSYSSTISSDKNKIDSAFSFHCTPYIGLGINF